MSHTVDLSFLGPAAEAFAKSQIKIQRGPNRNITGFSINLKTLPLYASEHREDLLGLAAQLAYDGVSVIDDQEDSMLTCDADLLNQASENFAKNNITVSDSVMTVDLSKISIYDSSFRPCLLALAVRLALSLSLSVSVTAEVSGDAHKSAHKEAALDASESDSVTLEHASASESSFANSESQSEAESAESASESAGASESSASNNRSSSNTLDADVDVTAEGDFHGLHITGRVVGTLSHADASDHADARTDSSSSSASESASSSSSSDSADSSSGSRSGSTQVSGAHDNSEAVHLAAEKSKEVNVAGSAQGSLALELAVQAVSV